jgi:hypothetical protein
MSTGALQSSTDASRRPEICGPSPAADSPGEHLGPTRPAMNGHRCGFAAPYDRSDLDMPVIAVVSRSAMMAQQDPIAARRVLMRAGQDRRRHHEGRVAAVLAASTTRNWASSQLALSRRKQGFESPRERHKFKDLAVTFPRLASSDQRLTKDREALRRRLCASCRVRATRLSGTGYGQGADQGRRRCRRCRDHAR